MFFEFYVNKIKYSMANIVIDQFEDEDLMLIDSDREYYCSPFTKSTGFTLLMKLVLIPNTDIKILENEIKNNDINIKNAQGLTALMIACRNSKICNNMNTIKLLLNSKANVDLQDNCGWSALMMASRYSNSDSSIEIVKLLFDHKANVDLQDNYGWSALMIASRYSNETIKLLLDHKANIDLQNSNGWSALIIASRYSNEKSTIETVKLLLDYKANVDLQNNNNLNALMLTSRYSNEKSSIETAKLLLNHMINNNNNFEMTNELFGLINDDMLDYFVHKNIHNIDKVIDNLKYNVIDITKVIHTLHKNHMRYKVYFDDVMSNIIKCRNAFYFDPDNIYNKIVILSNNNFSHSEITDEHKNKISMLLGCVSNNKKVLLEFRDYLVL